MKNCKALEKMASMLLNKAKEQGVEFEAKKTEFIHFHTRRREETCGLTINGYYVKLKPLVRWLGI